MKAFVVELKIEAVVMAEDEAHATEVARDCEREIMSDTEPDVWLVNEAKTVAELPTPWNGMCIPYGGDGDTRLDDLLPAGDYP